MKRPTSISPRKDFSPIRLRIANTGRRPRMVPLFRTAQPGQEKDVVLLHPDMHYGVLCSMLDKVQLRIDKTYLQLIKGNAAQLEESIILQVLERADQPILFHDPPRFTEVPMRASEAIYRLGPSRRLLLKVWPQTTVELCFFISGGVVPAGIGRPVEAEIEQ